VGQLIDRASFESGVHNNRFVLHSGQVLSPSALDLARERGVEIVREGSARDTMPQQSRELEALSERIARRLLDAGHAPGAALIDAVAAEVTAIASGDADPMPLLDAPTDGQMMTCLSCGAQRVDAGRERVVITSAGRNTTGIVAALAASVAEAQANILDISQTLVGDFFTMIMVIDIAAARYPFEQIRAQLLQVGADLGIHVAVMQDDLLKSMHRV